MPDIGPQHLDTDMSLCTCTQTIPPCTQTCHVPRYKLATCVQERLDQEKAKKEAARREAADKAKAEGKDKVGKDRPTENGSGSRGKPDRAREGRDANRSLPDRELDRDRPAGRSDRCASSHCMHPGCSVISDILKCITALVSTYSSCTYNV